jgi:hypothetical protein
MKHNAVAFRPAKIASAPIAISAEHRRPTSIQAFEGVYDRTERVQCVRGANRTSCEQVTLAFETLVQREADAIESRVALLAEHTKCNEILLLDALTIEMTGRFTGRICERDEKILKTQPIV